MTDIYSAIAEECEAAMEREKLRLARDRLYGRAARAERRRQRELRRLAEREESE